MAEPSSAPYGIQQSIPRPRSGATPFVAISLVSLACASLTMITLYLTVPAPATLVVTEAWLEQTVAQSGPGTGPGFTEPAPESSDDGELRVEEFGYSVIERPTSRPVVSWGAIVVNDSDEMAGQGQVRVLFSDVNGAPVQLSDSHVTVPPIPPNGRIGIGNVTYVSDPDITDLRLDVGQAGWWNLASSTPVATMSTGEVQAQWAPRDHPPAEWTNVDPDAEPGDYDRIYLRFHVDSQHSGIVDSAGAVAVYRDDTGAIIGATMAPGLEAPNIIPPGSSYQLMQSQDNPPPEYEAIEIYVHL
ncbi:hypothetical protein FB566_2541 [Stackebrandtia endophytica]|uniref:Uncharacterized protein n=1 Tax=Stackebrandtia endophytica TaxID=1496996 RepID=A0A543AWP4_9ACTN|nr:hypothetical protein [Stackebrandtia endophytica]TQL76997.1 hypothetical protein FB566_2541 [Stackebrandtia endophytica]